MAENYPEPLRPLGAEGRKAWRRLWASHAEWVTATTDAEAVQMLCESLDERVGLRVMVLQNPADWRTRAALRNLDVLVTSLLAALGLTPAERTRLNLEKVEPAAVGKLAQLRAVTGGADGKTKRRPPRSRKATNIHPPSAAADA